MDLGREVVEGKQGWGRGEERGQRRADVSLIYNILRISTNM